jgi:malate synthase
MMEDAATAEISRSQIWQWIHHGVKLEDGRTVSAGLVRGVLDEETGKIREQVGDDVWRAGRPGETREIFERVALSEELVEFLTIPAYEYLA